MKIAPLQSGSAPRQLPVRSGPKRTDEAPDTRRSGKIRHVLHGWRILLGPLVAQVLERHGTAPAKVPPGYALSAYQRRLAAPIQARLLRDI